MKRQVVGIVGVVVLVIMVLLLGYLAFGGGGGNEPVKSGNVMPKREEIEKTAKELVEQMSRGEFSECIEKFDASMKKALPEAKLKAAWDSVVGQAGEFQRQTGSRYERSWGYDVIFVSCEFEDAVLETKVVFNKLGEVAGLFFVPGK